MKTMTCKQLAGACDLAFHAETFGEMAELSKKHGMEMYQNGDEPHVKAMETMTEKMNDPEEMNRWYQSVQDQFIALPEDN
jgi:hypothetical protein